MTSRTPINPKVPLISYSYDYESELARESWCYQHHPWIFDRVVWTRIFGEPFNPYTDFFVQQKIQLSYLSKAVRAVKIFFLGEYRYYERLHYKAYGIYDD